MKNANYVCVCLDIHHRTYCRP